MDLKRFFAKSSALLLSIVMVFTAVGPVSILAEPHTHDYGEPAWSYSDKYYEKVTLNVNDGLIVLDPAGYTVGGGAHVDRDNSVTEYIIVTGGYTVLDRPWLIIHEGMTSASVYNLCFQSMYLSANCGARLYGMNSTVNLTLRGANNINAGSEECVFQGFPGDSSHSEGYATLRIAGDNSAGGSASDLAGKYFSSRNINLQKTGELTITIGYHGYQDFSEAYTAAMVRLGYRDASDPNPFSIGKPAVAATFSCACGDTQTVPDFDPKTVTVTAAGCTTDRIIKHTGTVTFNGGVYAGETAPEEVPGTALGHKYGQPAWSFAEDGSSATASFPCTRCGNDTQTVTDPAPTRSQYSAATCEQDQMVRYYGRVTFQDETYDGESEPIPVPGTALGHLYGEAVWNWAEDYRSATAAFFCERGDDMQTVTDTEPLITAVTEPDCVTDETAICKATVTFNDKTYTNETQVVTVPGTALGHSYGAPVWTWANDNSAATASFTCAVCGGDTQTVTDPSPVLTEVAPAGCVTDQRQKYVSTVSFLGETYTAETEAFSVPGTALGHCYGDPVWTFAEDGSSAAACFTCTRCAADTQTVTDPAPVRTEVSPANCTDDLKIKYTAAVTFEDQVYTGETRPVSVPGTAWGHTYGAPVWTWEEDYGLATARFTCSVCGKGRQTVTDPAPTLVEITPATETTDRVVAYLAAIRFMGKVYTDQTEAFSVPGTATGVPDDPGTPEQTEDLCPWDHVDHGNTVFGKIVRLFHNILYVFSKLIGR